MARRGAVVTGGSRGIGRATALALAQAGHDVLVHYHQEEAKAKAVAREVERLGASAVLGQADLSSAEGARSLFAVAEQVGLRIDVLVNNAGVYPRTPFEEISETDWSRTLDANVSSQFHCAKLAAPGMRARKWGRIINLSSILGQKGSRHGAHYAASKAAILGLTRSLALELAPHNVTVNAVAPGAIETDILSGDTKETRERRLREIPMKRVGAPEEVAACIVFLASDAASYVTGQVLAVNGGLLTA